MIRRPAVLICAGALAASFACGRMAMAELVLEWNFDQTDGAVPTTTGMGINTNPDDFFPTNLYDATGNVGQGQSLSFGGVHPQYVVDSDIPNAPATLPPGWDGHAVRFQGENYARFQDEVLNFQGSFTAWARIYREGSNPLNSDSGSYNVLGSSQKNNGGWGIKLDYDDDPTGEPKTLDAYMNDGFGTLGPPLTENQEGVFGNIAGPVIEDETWYDIGIVYDGTPTDGFDDTLKFFLDGQVVGEFTGDASFFGRPFGFSFAIGMDSFGNEGFPGLYERILLWNEAITDEDMAALSNPPTPMEMPDLNMDGAVDIFDVAIVSNNWGNTGAPGSVDGDANKDGTVDIFDIALISNNWNPGSATPAPEPSTIALLAVAGCAIVPWARRRSIRRGAAASRGDRVGSHSS